MQKDFSIISNFLAGISQNIETVPEWDPNEYVLINSYGLYIPRVVDAFQNWSLENQQSRFLAHILLDPGPHLIYPTLKDLGRSLSTLGLSSIVSPMQIDDFANLSYIDRALGQIMDTIKARKIENRTIFFVLMPIDKGDGKKSSLATGIFKIPGLVPKKNISFENISINDISSTLLTTVGIPAGKNIANASSDINGFMLEKIDLKEYNAKKLDNEKSNKQFIKYSMIIKPDANNCSSFMWNSKKQPIFSLQANFPIYQLLTDNSIEFFPCSIKNKFINLTWYQKNGDNLLSINNIEDF